MRVNRWDYLARIEENKKPTNECPTCDAPSRVYYIGAKTENGVCIHTWGCDHLHRWDVLEPRKGSVQ